MSLIFVSIVAISFLCWVTYIFLPRQQRRRVAKCIRRGLNQTSVLDKETSFENQAGYFHYQHGVLAADANGFAFVGNVRNVVLASNIFKKRFPDYRNLEGISTYERDEFLAFFATHLLVSRRVVAYVDLLHIRGVPALRIAERLEGF